MEWEQLRGGTGKWLFRPRIGFEHAEQRIIGKQLLLEPQEWNGSSCEGEWGNGGNQCSTKKMMASEEKGGIRDKLGITYSECSGDPE